MQLSPHTNQVAHQAATYLGIGTILPPGLNTSPSQVYPFPALNLYPLILYTHLYTWVEKGTARVKCLNTMSPARDNTQTHQSAGQALTMWPPCFQSTCLNKISCALHRTPHTSGEIASLSQVSRFCSSHTVEPLVATTSHKRPVFQNTKSLQVKTL